MATTEQRVEAGEFKRGSLTHMEAMYRETRGAFEEGRCSAAHAMGVFEALTGLLLDDTKEAAAAEKARIVAWLRWKAQEWEKRAAFDEPSNAAVLKMRWMAHATRELADAIERGDHAETPAPGSEGGASVGSKGCQWLCCSYFAGEGDEYCDSHQAIANFFLAEGSAAEKARIVALIRDFESTWAKRNRNAQSRLEPVFGAFAEAAGILAELIEGTDEDGFSMGPRPSEDPRVAEAEEATESPGDQAMTESTANNTTAKGTPAPSPDPNPSYSLGEESGGERVATRSGGEVGVCPDCKLTVIPEAPAKCGCALGLTAPETLRSAGRLIDPREVDRLSRLAMDLANQTYLKVVEAGKAQQSGFKEARNHKIAEALKAAQELHKAGADLVEVLG